MREIKFNNGYKNERKNRIIDTKMGEIKWNHRHKNYGNKMES